MILDDTDLKILKVFCKLKEDEETTTWRIMKKLYPKGRDVEHKIIKERIKKMARYDLFHIEDGFSDRNKLPNKKYTLIKDNVCLKIINFPDKKGLAVILKIDGNQWDTAYRI